MVRTLDAAVRAAITGLFPGGATPDKENFRLDGTQYKAPDHEVWNGRLLIERKSLNAVDNSQYYEKVADIARGQGKPMVGYGMFDVSKMITAMPDPAGANRKFVDYVTNQLKKSIREARKKFDEHGDVTGRKFSARVLIISDHAEMRSTTDAVEYVIGERFIRSRRGSGDTGLIDAIIYVKNPRYVFLRENSYWFKCVIRREAVASLRKDIEILSLGLHEWLAKYEFSVSPELNQTRGYRPLIA